jgi:hypothetical protein
MAPLSSLLVLVVLFAVAAYGLFALCTYFKMPQSVFWICGAILIIILLSILIDKSGLYHFHG